MFRRLAAATTALALAVFVAAPVLAGGWAEIVADARTTEPPPVEGQPIDVGFTVLQHGVTPAGWESPTVTFTEVTTGETFQVAAIGSGVDGHFVATATVPRAGSWTWSVTLRDLATDRVVHPLSVAASEVALTAGGGDVPLAGVVMISILSGASAGFVMAWLAGRSRPRELDVSPSSGSTSTPSVSPRGSMPG